MVLSYTSIFPLTADIYIHVVHFALPYLQAFAAAVGDEFKFLDAMDYMYESEGETEAPDPWNSFHNIATEDQEDEQEPRYGV